MKKKNIFIIIAVIVIFSAAAFVLRYEQDKKTAASIKAQKEQAQKAAAKKAEEQKKKQEETEKEKAEAAAQAKQKQMDTKYEEGKKLFLDHQYLNAISIADELIKEDSNYYPAYNLKGIALCYYGSNFDVDNFTGGMENIDKSLKLKPDYEYGLFNKALAYELYAKYDDAIIWYNKALAVQKDEWAYYGIASIYGRRGDVENSVKYLKLAIAMNPGIKNDAKTEPDFDNVKNSELFQDATK